MKNSRKKQLFSLFLCTFLFLDGCSSAPAETLDGQKWDEDWTQIGTLLGVEPMEPFTLLDNKDILAADGLYYAAWTAGSPVPYENSDGDMTDLYDAQLYLLFNETADESSAEKKYQTWLASAKDNYEVHQEDTITCNGQSYTRITYDCVSENNPYDRGVSVFGICGANVICAELTCVEDYSADLVQLLTGFLEGCHYSSRTQEHQ